MSARLLVASPAFADVTDVPLHESHSPLAIAYRTAWDNAPFLRFSLDTLEYPETGSALALKKFTDPQDNTPRWGILYTSDGEEFLEDFPTYTEANESYLQNVVTSWPFRLSDVTEDEYNTARAFYDAHDPVTPSFPWSEKDAPWAVATRLDMNSSPEVNRS